MVTDFKRNQRLGLTALNDMVREIRQNRIHAGGAHAVHPGPGGASVLVHQPTLRHVYVIRADSDGIAVKEARWINDRWSVVTGSAHEFFAEPFPGYTFRDFERYVITDPDDPADDERSCLLLDNNRVMPPALDQQGPAANLWHGKIIALNLHTQLAVVAPINPGVNPTDTGAWSNDANFDVAGSTCCWTGGFTGLSDKQPVVVTKSGDSEDLPWLSAALQITRADFAGFCGPQGPVAPLIAQNCTPPPNEPVCSIGACCVEGVCSSTTSVACAAAGGVFYEGLSCEQAAIQHPDDCVQLSACCMPDRSCFEATVADCQAAGGTAMEGMTCGEANCPQPETAPCCLPDGSCIEATAGDCLSMGGTLQPGAADCVEADCQPPMGCCVGISGTMTDTTQFVCDTIGETSQWLPCPCSDIADPFNPICP